MKATFQHFVPRFVLRQFVETLGSKESKHRISVYDLAENRTFTASLGRIAGSNSFYDYRTRSGKIDSVDPFLTNIEGLTAPAWKKLIETRNVAALKEEERLALALFITSLVVRGPSTRAIIEALPGLTIEELKRRGHDTSIIETKLRGEPGDDERIHASNILTVSAAFPAIASMTWRLYAPPPDRRFCSSDNPVLKFNDLDYGPMGKLGLLQAGIFLQVALSSDLLLLIADPGTYPIGEGPVEEYTEDNLLHYNYLLAFFAHKHLYAKSANDFDVRPGMWRGRPHIEIVRPDTVSSP
jgi:hypothetical protein